MICEIKIVRKLPHDCTLAQVSRDVSVQKLKTSFVEFAFLGCSIVLDVALNITHILVC